MYSCLSIKGLPVYISREEYLNHEDKLEIESYSCNQNIFDDSLPIIAVQYSGYK